MSATGIHGLAGVIAAGSITGLLITSIVVLRRLAEMCSRLDRIEILMGDVRAVVDPIDSGIRADQREPGLGGPGGTRQSSPATIDVHVRVGPERGATP